MFSMTEGKLFGRYHEVMLLVIGFALTGICGALIGNYLQNRSWERQHFEALMESQRSSAQNVFSDVSRLIDARLYKMRRLHWGFRNASGRQEMKNRWLDYREALVEWNSNLNRSLSLVEIYFGNQERIILEDSIQQKFISIGMNLENFDSRSANYGHHLRLIERELNKLDAVCYQFNITLLKAIRDGRIGRFQ